MSDNEIVKDCTREVHVIYIHLHLHTFITCPLRVVYNNFVDADVNSRAVRFTVGSKLNYSLQLMSGIQQNTPLSRWFVLKNDCEMQLINGCSFSTSGFL